MPNQPSGSKHGLRGATSKKGLDSHAQDISIVKRQQRRRRRRKKKRRNAMWKT
jgi:hypothetical protein